MSSRTVRSVVIGLAATLLLAGPAAAGCFDPPLAVPTPVPWDSFDSDPGFTVDYTSQGVPIADYESSGDPSNGGSSPQPSSIDIASCSETNYPPGSCTSAMLGYYNGGTPNAPSPYDPDFPSTMDDDFILFRWRVDADPRHKESFDKYHWNVLFDVDGDGYKEYWLDLDGTFDKKVGSLVEDRVRILYDNGNRQDIPNPDAAAVVDLPAYNDDRPGSYSRAYQAPGDSGDFYIEVQIPMQVLKDLDCNQVVYPDSPIAFFYSTGASNNDPLQKDHMMDGDFINLQSPINFGDVVYPNGRPTVEFTDSGVGFVSLYRIGDTVYAYVADRLVNGSTGTASTVDQIQVTVTDPATGDSEVLILTETSASSGIFTSGTDAEGRVATATTDGAVAPEDGLLEVLSGDELLLTYTNHLGHTVSDTAVILGPCGASIRFTRANGLPSTSFELKSSASTSDKLFVTVTYPDANTLGGMSPAVVDTITVSLSSVDGAGDAIASLTLRETGPDTGVFRNSLPGVATKISDGTIDTTDTLWEDVDGGEVRATYAFSCNGAQSVSTEASLFYVDAGARVRFTNKAGTQDVSLYANQQPVYVTLRDEDFSGTPPSCALTCTGSLRTTTVVVESFDPADTDFVTPRSTVTMELVETAVTNGICSNTFRNSGVADDTAPCTSLVTTTEPDPASECDLLALDGDVIRVTFTDCDDGDLDATNNTKYDYARFNAPAIVLNWVLYQPDLSLGSCDTEAVQLYNNSDADVDLSTYTLRDGNDPLDPIYSIADAVLPDPLQPVVLRPGESAWISFEDSPTTHPDMKYCLSDDADTGCTTWTYYLFAPVGSYPSNLLGDDWDQLLLYDGSRVVDYVGWSTSTTPSADFLNDDSPAVPGAWPDNAYVDVTSVPAGSSLVRSTTGVDTNTPADWGQSPYKLCQDILAITPALLTRFAASPHPHGLLVSWETAAQAGVVGYRLLREGPDGLEPVGDGYLPALPDAPDGGLYQVLDTEAAPHEPPRYVLLAVEGGGHEQRLAAARPELEWAATVLPEIGHATVSAAAPRPSLREAGRVERGVAVPARRGGGTDGRPDRLRVTVRDTGLYRITAEAAAAAAGVPVKDVATAIQRGAVLLSSHGAPVAWAAEQDPDALVFWGEAIDSLFTRDNVYWLDLAPRSSRWPSVASSPWGSPEPDATSPATVHAESDVFPTVINEFDPDADYWFWAFLQAGHATRGTVHLPFSTPDAVDAGGSGRVALHLKGWTDAAPGLDHRVRVALNGTTIGETTWDGLDRHTAALSFPLALLGADNTLTVTALLAPGVPNSTVLVDAFDVTFERPFVADGGWYLGSSGDHRVVSVGGLPAPARYVLDVTEPRRPRRLDGFIASADAEGHRVTFAAPGPDTTLAVIPEAAVRVPQAIEPFLNPGLRRASNGADYLVIAPAALRAGAERLAALRSAAGLETMVADLEDVYDVFRHGIPDPRGIRDLLVTADAVWRTPPRYVVLVGMGNQDYRDLQGLGGNLLPPVLVATPEGLYASDNALADLTGDDDVPEMAIGRLPVRTAAELDALLDRIEAYEATPVGAWAREVVLLADDEAGTDVAVDFSADAGRLAAAVPFGYTVERIDHEGATAATRAALRAALGEGRLAVVYVGHGGADRLGAEGFLTNADVPGLAAGEPFVLAALTCIVGYFQHPGFVSLGEELVLAESGAIATWAPTALSENAEARIMGEILLAGLAEPAPRRLGDLVLQALATAGARGHDPWLPGIYVLLGDPALELK